MPQTIEDEDDYRLADLDKKDYNIEKLDKIIEDMKRVIESIKRLSDPQKEFHYLEEILKQLKDALKELIEIDNETIIYDRIHDTQRRLSFIFLDCLIEHCFNKPDCPPCADLEDNHEYLIDISIEKYINDRILFYGYDHIGISHDDRAQKANKRINDILNCQKRCSLSNELFLNFIKEIMTDKRKKLGIRNRKAYWNYLKYQHSPDHDPKKDYEGACGFVERFHGYFWELNQTKNYKLSEEKKAKLINESNKLHILNGFELFQRCAMKRILSLSV